MFADCNKCTNGSNRKWKNKLVYTNIALLKTQFQLQLIDKKIKTHIAAKFWGFLDNTVHVLF